MPAKVSKTEAVLRVAHGVNNYSDKALLNAVSALAEATENGKIGQIKYWESVVSSIKSCDKDILSERNAIIKIACSITLCDYKLIYDKNRKKEFIHARQLVYTHFVEKYKIYSGYHWCCLFGAHHTTVMNSLKKHKDQLETDKDYREAATLFAENAEAAYGWRTARKEKRTRDLWLDAAICDRLAEMKKEGKNVAEYLSIVIGAELFGAEYIAKRKSSSYVKIQGNALFSYWLQMGFPTAKEIGKRFNMSRQAVCRRLKKYITEHEPDYLIYYGRSAGQIRRRGGKKG